MLAGRAPPWTSTPDQYPHWVDNSGESRLWGKTNDGSNYETKQ